jgi:hypothetical protein
MQPQDDDFPYTSDDPSLTPLDVVESSAVMTSQQVSDLKAALRVAIGSALNGTDLLIARVRRMQAMHETGQPGLVAIDENETAQDRLKFLLLGVLFELPDVFQRGSNTTGKFFSKVYGLVSRLTAPVTNSWLFSPVREGYDTAAVRGGKVVDRLIMKGRIEEQNSRNIIQQQAINDLVNEFVEYLVIKIKVQEIIQKEGTTMAVDVVGDFQQESSNVDALLESKLKSIFRRSPSPNPPAETSAPPENPAEGG